MSSLSATIFKARDIVDCSHDPRMMLGLPVAVELLHLLEIGTFGRGADGVCHTLLDEFGMIQP